METNRAHHRIVNAIQRSQRKASQRSTKSFKWYLMDLAHRRSLEGFTATVSTIPNMPQAVPAIGLRYFTDSGIIGSKEFVSNHYQRFKHLFAAKNKKLPKPVKGLSGMYSLKRLSEIL